jgi:hypothetical protein
VSTRYTSNPSPASQPQAACGEKKRNKIMSWIIMSIDKDPNAKVKTHWNRITAPSIEEAVRRGKALLKDAYEIAAVINAKYEANLG